MKFAVVGATGNVGYRLSQRLLTAGHEVRALSRGGARLQELVDAGAEPFEGSFDLGTPGLDGFFDGVDGAFTMVKSNWAEYRTHYASTASRLADALSASAVQHVVNLSSIGGELMTPYGHHYDFYQLESAINEAATGTVVHLRAGYFMENFLSWVPAVLRYQRVVTPFPEDLKIPCVCTSDVANAAFDALTSNRGYSTALEVGSHDYTMPEITRIISEMIDVPVRYESVDIEDPQLAADFIETFGLAERWEFDKQTQIAFNKRIARFGDNRVRCATSFEMFAHDSWRRAYEDMKAGLVAEETDAATWIPEDFTSWLSAR